jgi:hypothetical protein
MISSRKSGGRCVTVAPHAAQNTQKGSCRWPPPNSALEPTSARRLIRFLSRSSHGPKRLSWGRWASRNVIQRQPKRHTRSFEAVASSPLPRAVMCARCRGQVPRSSKRRPAARAVRDSRRPYRIAERRRSRPGDLVPRCPSAFRALILPQNLLVRRARRPTRRMQRTACRHLLL